jgi:hypothetical protein
MANIYKAGDEVVKQMKSLIKADFPHLLLIQDDIVVVFREKAKEAPGGQVILGTSKKAPALLSVLTDQEFQYKFIIELAEDSWHSLDPKQQEALIFHHLCSLRVEEDPDKGEIKCQLRPPDFYGYKEEVEKYGMWRPYDEEVLSAVEQMFGKPKVAAPQVKKKKAKAKNPKVDDEDLDDVADVATVQSRVVVESAMGDDIDSVLEALGNNS